MSTPDGEAVPVAVVGAGHMGRHHVRIYSRMAGVRLAAVIDRDLERARSLCTSLDGVACAATIDDYLRGAGQGAGDRGPPPIAAASIAVPTVHHLAVARPLIERGVGVLIEKPLAPNLAEAEQIAALARRHRAIVQVGHTERFNPAVRAVQRLDVRPKFVETHRISPFTFRSADVGVVLDMMIHDIDILLHLVRDEAERVDAVGVAVLGPHEDIASARITFRGGAVANLTASRLALKTERRLRVFAPTAYISLDYQKKVGIAITRDKNLDILKLARERHVEDLAQLAGTDFGKLVKVEPLQIDDRDALETELEAFVDCVRTRRPPPVSVDDGVAAIRLAEDIVRALKSRGWDV
ncbi:MAG TPA: Gfo/Idh/MocA family oxidoreductase [Phycisphaerae bacterium]|nr:Gfo/Idh/MocA family oxidoreductase [Phycisphaerae bacterium]